MKIISYDSPRGGVSVITEKGDTTTSFLLIQNARPSDSGQYTCNPSNAKSKSVTVHVLNGEYPAAMQRAGQPHHRAPLNHPLLVLASALVSSLLCSIGMLRLPSPSGGSPRVSFASS
uniref:Ig-like domain-containing protein n=1 Tax=Anopheles epiroticus TaxID=199890 RepID=A0A182P4J1_9DIPT